MAVQRLIAVDPGDVHTGVAFFEAPEDLAGDGTAWDCVATIELSPDEFEDELTMWILQNRVNVLVYERFLLYPNKAQQQTGSEFRTSQTIGVIKYLARLQDYHVRNHGRIDHQLMCPLPACKEGGSPVPITLVGQQATIKKPTRAILKTRGIKSTAKRNGDKLGHQVDAELHGYYYLLHGREE